ncbi:MAG TPA: hypothetical protein VLH59_11235 [Ignavibacteriaceae bacterium]|nr:hypothetical protein [Ignavibacteriaceae bacterium]
MKGIFFLAVFGIGLLGLNESFAQFISQELYVSSEYLAINKSTNSSTNKNVVSNSRGDRSLTVKDSLYDYQIYQRYYRWAYYPGLCGYTWGFRHLDGKLTGQLSALGYLPQLNYFNCPTEYSYYTDGSYNSLYWRDKKTKYIYVAKNSGSGRNLEIYEGNPLISMKENSIERVVSQAYTVKNFKKETQSDIAQSVVTTDKSEKAVQNIEIISIKRVVLVKQPTQGKEISIINSQSKDQLKTNLKEKGSWNTESISEKIKKDFKLSSGARKVYMIDKPKSTNGWENFGGIYSRSSQNNGNQDTEKTYNNNSQRSYSSGSGNNTQRNNSTQNSSRRSNVSTSKTRVVE